YPPATRDLRSSPTRRSSDLIAHQSSGDRTVAVDDEHRAVTGLIEKAFDQGVVLKATDRARGAGEGRLGPEVAEVQRDRIEGLAALVPQICRRYCHVCARRWVRVCENACGRA